MIKEVNSKKELPEKDPVNLAGDKLPYYERDLNELEKAYNEAYNDYSYIGLERYKKKKKNYRVNQFFRGKRWYKNWFQ